MWRTWRRHETDTKFFDTKSDREPSYHGRTWSHTLTQPAPRPTRREKCLLFLVFSTASPIRHCTFEARDSRNDSAARGNYRFIVTIVCRVHAHVHASLGRGAPGGGRLAGRRMNPRAAAGGAGGARRP